MTPPSDRARGGTRLETRRPDPRAEALLLPDYRERDFEDVFTGERRTVSSDGTLGLSEVFEKFPVAILRSIG